MTASICSRPGCDRFAVNAGIDHNITVRHWHNDKKVEGRILASSNRFRRNFHTDLQNFNKSTRRIRVWAQVPVSEVDEIKVSRDGTTDGFTESEEFESWGYWDITLKPRRSRNLALHLDVSVPKDFKFSW